MFNMIYYCRVRKTVRGFFVSFPDFPDISASSSTKADALRVASEALYERLALDAAQGIIPPPPMYVGPKDCAVEVPANMLVALQIRQLRGKLSQKDVAQRLNITYQSYQDYENPAKSNPTIKNLERIARALGKRLKVEFI